MSMNEFFAEMRASANNGDPTRHFDYGELIAYDPITNTGDFELPLYIDSDSTSSRFGQPVNTGFVQLGTMLTGPGYGAQFPPSLGAQALIIYSDSFGQLPVAAVFLANDVETPPYTDGKTWGWKDAQGSSHTTTMDGPAEGDGVGAARTQGAAYTEHSTKGGHKTIQDDINRLIKILTTGGHSTLYDDANNLVKHSTSNGFYTLLDGNGRAISHVTPGGLIHTLNDETGEISTIAPNIGLGDHFANLEATLAAINQSHITAYDNNLQTAKLADYVKQANLYHSAGTVTTPQLATILAALVAGWTNGTGGISSLGSGITRIK